MYERWVKEIVQSKNERSESRNKDDGKHEYTVKKKKKERNWVEKK